MNERGYDAERKVANDLIVAQAAQIAALEREIDRLTFSDTTGHSKKMSVAEWLAYWRDRVAVLEQEVKDWKMVRDNLRSVVAALEAEVGRLKTIQLVCTHCGYIAVSQFIDLAPFVALAKAVHNDPHIKSAAVHMAMDDPAVRWAVKKA